MPDDGAFEWSKQTYEDSVASSCWWYTPYDAGWDESHEHEHDLREDAELREIVRVETALAPLPNWAREVVHKTIANIPPCGHYSFPAAYLRVVDAIGSERPAPFNYCCYTADADRKREAMDYCLCLDAWLAGATAESAATELNALGFLQIDWDEACVRLWSVLGEPSRTKELLVERTLLQLRWWVKALVWPNDRASNFGRDQYLGDYRKDAAYARDNGNPEVEAPVFDLKSSPRARRMEDELDAGFGHWPWFRDRICATDGMNLCAPKTFRYLERLLFAIGRERPLQKDEQVPGFLSAEATYPNHDEAAVWWRQFLEGLRNWWQEEAPDGDVAEDIARRLGERTRIKAWLVRLYVRRLELHAACAEIGRLVTPVPGRMRGARPIAPGQQTDPVDGQHQNG